MRNIIPLPDRDWTQTGSGPSTIYRIRFECPVVYYGDAAFLELEAQTPCTVILNGIPLAGGETGFLQIPLDEAMDPGGNLLEIMAAQRPAVSILLVPHSHFEVHEDGTPAIEILTRALEKEGTILAGTRVRHPFPGDAIRYILYDENGTEIDRMDVSALTESPAPLFTGKPSFWQATEHPALYTVCAQLLHAGKIRDEVSVSTGLRTYSIQPDGTVLFNGKKIHLKGMILDREVTEEDLTAWKEAGYNCLWNRVHQPDSRFYNWCDKLGLVLVQRYLDSTKEQARKVTNHPSLCFWCVPHDTSIQTLQKVRALDPTRLIVMEIQDPCQSDLFSDLCIVSAGDLEPFRTDIPAKPLAWIEDGGTVPDGLWATFSLEENLKK